MWFAVMDSPRSHPWFLTLVVSLLQGDRPTLRLLRRSPFPEGPPAAIRARLYLYRFSKLDEHRREPGWWVRTPVGDYLPVVRLDGDGGLGR